MLPITDQDRFQAWLKALDEIFYTETGLSLQDLPDQNYRDLFDDGCTPEDAYYQVEENLYPGVETTSIYYQEFELVHRRRPGTLIPTACRPAIRPAERE